MVIENITDVVMALGKIGLWIQALGIFVVLWVVFQIFNSLINGKRLKEVYNIKEDMKRIEGKIDKLLVKRK